MFTRILVPLDGSAYAERALPYAARVAETTGADVALIRVVEVVAPGEREPGVISYLDENRVAAAEAYVRRAAALEPIGRTVSAEARLAADVVAGILGKARDYGADVIVMASRGESWADNNVMGGTALALLEESGLPVVVLGPRCGEERDADDVPADVTPAEPRRA